MDTLSTEVSTSVENDLDIDGRSQMVTLSDPKLSIEASLPGVPRSSLAEGRTLRELIFSPVCLRWIGSWFLCAPSKFPLHLSRESSAMDAE